MQRLQARDFVVYGDGDNGDTIPANSTTTATISVGGTFTSQLETPDDVDWIAINLQAGQTVVIDLQGTGTTPVGDTYLRLWGPGSTDPLNGTLVAENDDGGQGYNSKLVFTAQTAGTYYIDVSSYAGSYSGEYTVSVDNFSLSPWTYQQISHYLRVGYWQDNGADYRNFDVGNDGAITVDLTGLSAQYQAFAREALDTWSDITGIQFVEVSGNAEITFQSNGSLEAWSSSSVSGHTIVSSLVNVSTDWVTSQGEDYTLQTFIHEIGHALGLGHAGNYNGSAVYPDDALYANDSWQASVMSYFSQSENTAVNASFAWLLTPMMADVLAMQSMYGLSTTTRSGNTVYGYHSNAGDRFDLGQWTAEAPYALTIVDSGGIDTLDLSLSGWEVHLDLRPGTFSDIMGLVGNLGIAFGTIIENAIGSAYADNIGGNKADNILRGNGGDDLILGRGGNDTLLGGDGNDTLYGNAGDDLLRGHNGDDILNGGGGDDALYGGNGNDELRGGGGNDVAFGGGGDDRLYGGGGDDLLSGMGGADRLYGHAGNDTLDGGGGADNLYGGDGADQLYGGAGKDHLVGGTGNDVLDGGTGADVLRGGDGADTFVYGLNGDRDRIIDFQDNVDTIDLSAWGFASVSDALAYATEVNGHVKFDFTSAPGGTAGDILWVNNITITQLTDDIIV